jgi:bifunctional ADP-heptose synthase (sugar kinase/adenylyltransferase)
LAANLSVELSTCLANVAAGIAVGKSGTVAVSLDELLAHAELGELKKKLPLVPDLCAGE